MKLQHYYLFHRENLYKDDISSITLLGDLVCTPDYYREPHHHSEDIEICLITAGKGSFIIEDTEYKVKQGDLFFAMPYQVHHSIADPHDPYRMYYLAFRLFDDPVYKKLYDEMSHVTQHVFTDQFNLPQYFSALIEEVLNNFTARNKAIESLFHSIVIFLHRNCLVDKAGIVREYSSKQLLIQKITTYIDSNIHQKFYLDDIANELGYSSYYISRVFKEQMDMPLSGYWNRAKILRARYLLKNNPEMTLLEASERVGIDDYHYFSRLYKQITGLSPTADRKIIQET